MTPESFSYFNSMVIQRHNRNKIFAMVSFPNALKKEWE